MKRDATMNQIEVEYDKKFLKEKGSSKGNALQLKRISKDLKLL